MEKEAMNASAARAAAPAAPARGAAFARGAYEAPRLEVVELGCVLADDENGIVHESDSGDLPGVDFNNM